MPTEMDTASFMGFTGPVARGAGSGATHAKRWVESMPLFIRPAIAHLAQHLAVAPRPWAPAICPPCICSTPLGLVLAVQPSVPWPVPLQQPS